jgi:peptidoglycan hydrolase CwlO-like protein
MIDPISLGTMLATVGMAVAPALGWCFKLTISHAKLETRNATLEEQIKTVVILTAKHETEVALIRSSFNNLGNAMSRAEERHKEIAMKLDVLPKVEAVLENLVQVCKVIVPRNEIDQRFEAQDRQMANISCKPSVKRKTKIPTN